MKYKVGDRVRIVKDMKCIKASRSRYLGAIMTIKGIHALTVICDICYEMEEDDGMFYWTEDMIEGLVEDNVTTGSLSSDNGVHIINW